MVEVAVIDGVPYVVEIVGFKVQPADPFFETPESTVVTIRLLTNGAGDANPENGRWEETHDLSAIVSFLPIQSIPTPVTIYHYLPVGMPANTPPKASEYIATTVTDQPFVSSTNHGLGSGIYGLYFPNPQLAQLQGQKGQTILPIPCQSPYYLQGAKHGDSLTTASKMLDRVVDAKLATGRNQPLTGLVNIWNLVFYQSHRRTPITSQLLTEVIDETIRDYRQPQQVDLAGRQAVTAPINRLMTKLGFDSIVAGDSHNNDWSRGCVRYPPYPGVTRLETRQSRITGW